MIADATGTAPPALRPVLSELAVGDSIGTRTLDVDRARLVRYAGASGDFNPLHYSDRVATEVGLPGVIAHGMWTMGAAVNLVVDWAGDPGAVVDYQVRFTRPVPVPDPGQTHLEVAGTIAALDRDASTVRIDLTVTHEGKKVLAKSSATIHLP